MSLCSGMEEALADLMSLRMTNFEKVVYWREKFNLPTPNKTQRYIDPDREALRQKLIAKEFYEFNEAVSYEDPVQVAYALADLLWVVYGTAAEYGIPIDDVFHEVAFSNMTKLGPDGKPILREDGKILKGPDFRPPNIESILEAHNNEH